MRRLLVPVLLLCAGLGAQEAPGLVFGKKPYQVRPLGFTVQLPDGWQATQDRTGMVAQVARRPTGMGFMVTREPLFHTPKRFGEAWQATLAAAGLDTKVGKARASRYAGWTAKWETESGGGRSVQVVRVRVPELEMLYNFSFTAPGGGELKPLVDGVLRSFKITEARPKLEFQPTAASVGARISLTLPKGYAEVPRGVRLGGGDQRGYVKMLEGYEKPHRSGRIGLRQMRGNSTKDAVDRVWEMIQAEYGKVTNRPRKRSAKVAEMKGHSLTAGMLTKDGGLPKQFFAFAGKAQPGVLLVMTVVVDDRDVRLHKDLFKQICKKFKIQGG